MRQRIKCPFTHAGGEPFRVCIDDACAIYVVQGEHMGCAIKVLAKEATMASAILEHIANLMGKE